MIRTYSDLVKFETFEERYRYLKLQGSVGFATFGHDRWMNQRFYTSRQWRQLRHHVIARDNGCDLASSDHSIFDKAVIHHMNPVDRDQIIRDEEAILDPEFLITTTHNTHNAIHYGDESLLPREYVPRRPGDTTLW